MVSSMLSSSLLKIRKRIKRFRHENPRITTNMAQTFSLCCIGLISLNSIVKAIFRKNHQLFFSLFPVFVIIVQLIFYFFYKRQSDKEAKEYETIGVINSDDYYIEECKSGWIDVGKISYKDYVQYKMYKAYPLKDWTPQWEKLMEYGN